MLHYYIRLLGSRVLICFDPEPDSSFPDGGGTLRKSVSLFFFSFKLSVLKYGGLDSSLFYSPSRAPQRINVLLLGISYYCPEIHYSPLQRKSVYLNKCYSCDINQCNQQMTANILSSADKKYHCLN